MRYLFLWSVLTIMFGCQSQSSQSTNEAANKPPSVTATAVPTATDTTCYQQIVGRDTTTLRLVLNKDEASGYLDNKPFEKDRAQGAFEGKVIGNTIKADWARSGEGVTQHYLLDLTLKADAISFPEGERIEQQGKWVLKQPKPSYTYVLNKTACP
jgi:hypothetical protein